jgi:hypothetical protein
MEHLPWARKDNGRHVARGRTSGTTVSMPPSTDFTAAHGNNHRNEMQTPRQMFLNLILINDRVHCHDAEVGAYPYFEKKKENKTTIAPWYIQGRDVVF